ncbi:MAG: glycoside hydrolase family 9 protein [Verrucomicrobiota bacterium]
MTVHTSSPRSKGFCIAVPAFLMLHLIFLVTVKGAIPNGSFEEGTAAPSGWHLPAGAQWKSGDAHAGQRFVRVPSSDRSQRNNIESELIALPANETLRLEAWVRSRSRMIELGVELLGDAQRSLGNSSAQFEPTDRGWEYVAFEFDTAKSMATHGKVWLRAGRETDLDDVRLHAVATEFIGNPGFEKDARGRISFWSDEKMASVLDGTRGGFFSQDTNVLHQGKATLAVTATNDWFAVASVNYPLADWTDQYEIGVWAKCDANARVQLAACWVDDMQNLIRAEAGPPSLVADWQRLSMNVRAPPGAASLRMTFAVRGGQAWFSAARLARLASLEKRLRILVNQIGYDSRLPKSAVIAANFFPAASTSLEVDLLRENGKRVWRGKTQPCAGRIYGGTNDDWGWYFWRFDFSKAETPGRYRLHVRAGDVQAESATFTIGRGVPLSETAGEAVDFFFIQRCGIEIPGWHPACHLDDAKLPDGTVIDATGGWHSAGDYNKLMYEHGDGGVAFALIEASSAAPNVFDKFDRDGDRFNDALQEALWGAEFVARMQVPETGGLRNHVLQGPGRNWTKWSAPETHTDNVRGTEDDPVIQAGDGSSPYVIGAWAVLSKRPADLTRLPDFLRAALRLWDHATGGGTNAGGAQLLIGTLDLHRVTQNAAHFAYASRTAERLLTGQNKSGPRSGAFGAYGEFEAAALARFALDHPRDPLVPRIKEALIRYTDFAVASADNPFGLSQRVVGEGAHYFPPDLGHNFQLLARAWAAALIYRVTGDRRALTYAVDHLDWVVGKNPINLCMFEGKGTVNPPRYHHRYNMIPGRERGAVPGTIPNGFVRDMGLADRPGFDLSRGGNRSPSYRTSEPWLVHNLYYLLAAAELYRASESFR